MSAILNLLYREYCRARLAEMRKQLLLSVNDEIPAGSWDASDAAGPSDRGRNFGDDIATQKPQPSGDDNGSVNAPARYLSTSRASRAT